MIWVVLIFAGLFEVLGVMMISYFHQQRNLRSVVYMIGSFGISFALLKISLMTLPMATAYAIWTGIGAAGGALVGMMFFGESKEMKRIFFITLIIASVVGLKVIGS